MVTSLTSLCVSLKYLFVILSYSRLHPPPNLSVERSLDCSYKNISRISPDIIPLSERSPPPYLHHREVDTMSLPNKDTRTRRPRPCRIFADNSGLTKLSRTKNLNLQILGCMESVCYAERGSYNLSLWTNMYYESNM